MSFSRPAYLALAVALLLPAAVVAQGSAKPALKPKPKVESQEDLAKLAKVTLEAATASALKLVPGAAVQSHELEREDGKLIYTFDMKTAGKAGIEEVNIDAITGKQVGKIEHEKDPAPTPKKKGG